MTLAFVALLLGVGLTAPPLFRGPSPVSWANAQKYCKDRNGRLVVVDTQAKANAVDAICGYDCGWIGATCHSKSSVCGNDGNGNHWSWTDANGVPIGTVAVGYTSWASGFGPQGNEGKTEYCAHFYKKSGSKGTWAAGPCDNTAYYRPICEKTLWRGPNKVTWEAGKTYCKNSGAQLAIIDTPGKAAVVDQFCSYDCGWLGAHCPSKSSVCGYDGNGNHWYWYGGSQRLEKLTTGYTAWDSTYGAPGNQATVQYCAHWFRKYQNKGTWAAAKCDRANYKPLCQTYTRNTTECLGVLCSARKTGRVCMGESIYRKSTIGGDKKRCMAHSEDVTLMCMTDERCITKDMRSTACRQAATHAMSANYYTNRMRCVASKWTSHSGNWRDCFTNPALAVTLLNNDDLEDLFDDSADLEDYLADPLGWQEAGSSINVGGPDNPFKRAFSGVDSYKGLAFKLYGLAKEGASRIATVRGILRSVRARNSAYDDLERKRNAAWTAYASVAPQCKACLYDDNREYPRLVRTVQTPCDIECGWKLVSFGEAGCSRFKVCYKQYSQRLTGSSCPNPTFTKRGGWCYKRIKYLCSQYTCMTPRTCGWKYCKTYTNRWWEESTATREACCTRCRAKKSAGCKSWTWDRVSKKCFLLQYVGRYESSVPTSTRFHSGMLLEH